MNPTHDKIKRKLLQNTPLTPDEAPILLASPDLREYKDAVDLAHGLVDNSAEPPKLVDDAILAYARRQVPQPRARRGVRFLGHWQVWHLAAGAMAACLAILMTIQIFHALKLKSTSSDSDETQEIARGNAVPGATNGPVYLASGTKSVTNPSFQPSAASAAARDRERFTWDTPALDADLATLESQVHFDLQSEEYVGHVQDMFDNI